MFDSNSNSNIHRPEITDAELRSAAPAEFAEAPMPGASDRYTFLPTGRIVEAMRQEGWKPVEARQMGVRHLERAGFQRHLVRFQRRDQVAEVGDYAPEVILLNSHDRSSGYQIHAGLFRFVCRNGLMVPDSLIPSVYVRHTGDESPEIIQASFKILSQLRVLGDRVASFRRAILSEDTARAFAGQALQLRYPDPNRAPVRAVQLLAVRRAQQPTGRFAEQPLAVVRRTDQHGAEFCQWQAPHGDRGTGGAAATRLGASTPSGTSPILAAKGRTYNYTRSWRR